MTRRATLLAAALYVLLAIGMTWPLSPVIARDIAWDLGDPLFNSWVMLWTSGQLLAFLSGDFTALGRYWHGNIFHPEPLTIAYSEHLAPQMIQALPIIASTGNVVLAYNLVFLATFVLSGLGTFLLVRDMTGKPVAAFVAGIAFAFAPYRISQLSHLQVLSSQWMPFVLYGFRRFLDTGRRRTLGWASAALVAQNLSCGYYLLFFAPFAGAYAVFELWVRRRLRDWAAWRAFAVAAAGVALCTLPMLLPYLSVRRGNVGVRTLGEITNFSADTRAFLAASPASWLWGERLSTFWRAEGEGFPGLAILILALGAITAGLVHRWRVSRETGPRPAWRQALTGAISVLLIAHLGLSANALLTGEYPIIVGGLWTQSHQPEWLLVRTVLLAIAWTLVTAPSGSRVESARTAWAFYAVATVAAAVLACGPVITAGSQVVAPGPYAWLMHHVPGFDGLRVPARYLMLVVLFLAVLAGLGAAALIGRWRRAGTALVVAAGLCMLVEGWPGPFQTNVPLEVEDFNPTPLELRVGSALPPLYKAIRDTPEGAVLVEFPFGIAAWDIQAVFYAGYHRQKLVNGYSGFFPDSQRHLIDVLNLRIRDPQAAWRGLLGSGATRVLVHEAAFTEARRHEVADWLLAQGAKELLTDGTDRLFAVR